MSSLATTKPPVPAPPALPTDVSVGAMEAALAMGDLSRLSSIDRLKYIGAICHSVGLNPLTKPIDIVNIGGKIVLYANKGCAEQLRALNGVSIEIISTERREGCIAVTARATKPDGRVDQDVGIVALAANATGDVLANATMKATTKAKRRVTLSICGLGMIDESELDTVEVRPVGEGPAVSNQESAYDRAARMNAKVKRAEVVAEEPTPAQPSEPAPTEAALVARATEVCPVPFDDATGWREAMIVKMADRWGCSMPEAEKVFNARITATGATSYITLAPARKAAAWLALVAGDLDGHKPANPETDHPL